LPAYYYFAASLPALVWGQRPGSGLSDFLAECERLLEEPDAAFVRAAVGAFDRPPDAQDRWRIPGALEGTALAEWFEWESCLRAELALLRAQALGRSFDGDSRPLRPDAQAAAKAAFDADSPYQAETILAEARFRAAELARSPLAWDREGIALYGVALAALERYHAFTEDAGIPRFEAAYAAILATKDA
jgi:hypothetical protein